MCSPETAHAHNKCYTIKETDCEPSLTSESNSCFHHDIQSQQACSLKAHRHHDFSTTCSYIYNRPHTALLSFGLGHDPLWFPTCPEWCYTSSTLSHKTQPQLSMASSELVTYADLPNPWTALSVTKWSSKEPSLKLKCDNAQRHFFVFWTNVTWRTHKCTYVNTGSHHSLNRNWTD